MFLPPDYPAIFRRYAVKYHSLATVDGFILFLGFLFCFSTSLFEAFPVNSEELPIRLVSKSQD